ncbi:hypothetical protein HY967_03725 [Candidatus Jorgensenbacteria bacterium]|nr:hypothetical protein [Candidatus Jorgensenbacteria bacterium]
MISKTPQFDNDLDKYFEDLVLDTDGGVWRTCRLSGEQFYIRPEDVDFCRRVRVPLPTLSPKERIRKKLAFHNSYNLFRVTSSFSDKSIVSQYPPHMPYPIFEHQIWFGEEWDPFKFGIGYEHGRDFFTQFKELQAKTPRPSLDVDNTNVESDYTNWSVRLKRCYLVFDSWQAEDSAYGIAIDDSKNCFDCFTTYNSDRCYDCFEATNMYQCFFSEYSNDCLDSSFLFDCRNCRNCFMCTNLRHKKYYFLNKPYTKEQYEEKIRQYNIGNIDVLRELQKQFDALKKQAIYKENHNERSVNSSGDYLKNSKNCHACFYALESENNAYSIGGLKIKDAYDSFGGAESEFIYDSHGGIRSYGLKFSFNIRESRNLEYCDLMVNCHDCFGCIGLKNKSFCILNKQYTENEYWQVVDEIKASMLKCEEYGEFFPQSICPIPYNISVATSYKGYDDIDFAKRYGYWIQEVPDTLQDVQGSVVSSRDLPKDIREVDDSLLNKIVFDEENKKQFRFVKAELDFYRKFNLPLPREHPTIRLRQKRKKFGTIILDFHERKCFKCKKSINSIYMPSYPEKVYCESCYNTEIV